MFQVHGIDLAILGEAVLNVSLTSTLRELANVNSSVAGAHGGGRTNEQRAWQSLVFFGTTCAGQNVWPRFAHGRNGLL